MTLKDKSHAEFEQEMTMIEDRIKRNHQENKKTLVWFYYSGHGVLETKTSIVCNKGPDEFFPIESELLRLSRNDGSFIVAVLDCCRRASKRGEIREN